MKGPKNQVITNSISHPTMVETNQRLSRMNVAAVIIRVIVPEKIYHRTGLRIELEYPGAVQQTAAIEKGKDIEKIWSIPIHLGVPGKTPWPYHADVMG